MVHYFGFWVSGRFTAKILNIQELLLSGFFFLCINTSTLSVSWFNKAISSYTIKITYFHLRIASPASLLLIWHLSLILLHMLKRWEILVRSLHAINIWRSVWLLYFGAFNSVWVSSGKGLLRILDSLLKQSRKQRSIFHRNNSNC